MTIEISLEPTTCPFCRSDCCSAFLQGKDQNYGVSGVFQLVKCDACQYVYLNPRPTTASIPDCYPTSYAPHQPVAEIQPVDAAKSATVANSQVRKPWYLSRTARAIPGLRRLYYWLTDTQGEFIPNLPQGQRRAVELGCAGGKFLEALRSRGWNAQGVELMPEPASAAQQRGFDVHLGTLDEAHFSDASFDAAFAFMVLEHLPDPAATLKEFHRILKPGGWLVLSIPNSGSWEARLFGRFWCDFELPRHLQHFTVTSIGKFLKKADFIELQVIHQRTVTGLIGSLGMVCREWFPRSHIGPTLHRWYLENPPLWAYLGTALLIKLIVPVLGSGRLTVLARKPSGDTCSQTVESGEIK